MGQVEDTGIDAVQADEDARALAYRQRLTTGRQAVAARARLLAGSRTARMALEARYEPLVAALKARRDGHG